MGNDNWIILSNSMGLYFAWPLLTWEERFSLSQISLEYGQFHTCMLTCNVELLL